MIINKALWAKIFGALLLGYLAWQFSTILVYIVVALTISVTAHPLVILIEKIKVPKLGKIPRSISSMIALLTVVGVIATAASFLIPTLIKQANVIRNIPADTISANFKEPISFVEAKLHEFSIISDAQDIGDFINEKVKSVISVTDFPSIVSDVANFTGSLLIGIISILFISYFFIKDDKMFTKIIYLLVPKDHHDSARRILFGSQKLLTRYFFGIMIESTTLFVLLIIAFKIFNIPNGMLMAFIFSIMNIIPYIGPLIGNVVGVFLGLTGFIVAGDYSNMLNHALLIFVIFYIVNMLDNFIIQPYIYSNSVKAHPLEIFIVTLMAGSVFGIFGMIIAIPLYTILRIIAGEFFSDVRFVKKLTEAEQVKESV